MVSTADRGAIEVAAGEGSVSIVRAQFEGAPEGPAAKVLSEVLRDVAPDVSRGTGSLGSARLE
jgi:hypothetical protein